MPEEAQVIRGQCPGCNAERRSYIRAEHVHRWHIDADGEHGNDTYRVLECAGCERVYFQIASSGTFNTEMQYIEELDEWYETERTDYIHYPPKMIRDKPHWMLQVQIQDSVLAKLLDELYLALNMDLSILPAIGARTVFDRASELLHVPSHLPFEKKLDELVNLGKIGRDERVVLDILVQAGSAAAHRGWAPRAADTATMMDVAESFLKSAFYLRHQAGEMGQRVPTKQRPPRQPRGVKPPMPPAATGSPVTPLISAPPSAAPTKSGSGSGS